MRDAGGQTGQAFTGNDGTAPLIMAYVRGGRTNPDGLARSDVQRVELVRDGDRLVRRAHAMVDGDDAVTTVVLAGGVTVVATRYRDATGAWRGRWDAVDPLALPRAAELTVTRGRQAPLTLAFVVGTPYP